MPLLFFNPPIAEACVKALSWTLVHSLWQSTAIAILAGTLIAITKKKKAHLRYNLLLGLFGLLLFISALTFLKELQHQLLFKDSSSSALVLGNTSDIMYSAATTVTGSEATQSVLIAVSNFLNRHASLIVLCWGLFFASRLCQFSYGISYIKRLKRSSVVPPGEWTSLMTTLCKRLGMRRVPVLMESSQVTVPLTFGFLKATILVPLSLLSSLPLNQVEAVLLHELAHIRRCDYLVNLFQNGAEMVFFFNPPLLWLSSLIRQERESCCDDIVLEHTAKKKDYLEALLSFQEYSIARTPAMAIVSGKNYLLVRIQRMLTKENQKLNSMEKTFLVLGVLAMSAFGFMDASLNTKSSPQPMVSTPLVDPLPQDTRRSLASAPSPFVPQRIASTKQKTPILATNSDTVPRQKVRTTRYSNVTTKSTDDGQKKIYEVEATDSEGKTYKLKKLNDELTEMEVDGKRIEATNEQFLEETNKDFQEQLAQLERLERSTGQKAKKELVEVNRKEYEKMKEKMEIQKKDFVKHQEEFKKHQQQLVEKQVKNVAEFKKMQVQRVDMQKQMAIKKTEMVKHKAEAIENIKRSKGSNDEINSIINELSRQGVITNTDELTFSLSNKELIVNGKKAPADLHQSLVGKHIKNSGDYFSYSKKGSSITTTINKE